MYEDLNVDFGAIMALRNGKNLPKLKSDRLRMAKIANHNFLHSEFDFT